MDHYLSITTIYQNKHIKETICFFIFQSGFGIQDETSIDLHHFG